MIRVTSTPWRSAALAIVLTAATTFKATAQDAATTADAGIPPSFDSGFTPDQSAAATVDPMAGVTGVDPVTGLPVETAPAAGAAAPTDPALAAAPAAAPLPPQPDSVYIDPETRLRAERQSRGEYGAMERSAGVPLGATQDAWNKPFRNMAEGQVAPGVVRFQWSPELVMPLRLREHMITTVVLPDWEKIRDVYIGENASFQAALIRDNALGLRTTMAGVDTSVTVVGYSGNLYIFYVRGESFNTQQITDLTVFVHAAPVNPGLWFTGQNVVTRPAMTAPMAEPTSPAPALAEPRSAEAPAPTTNALLAAQVARAHPVLDPAPPGPAARPAAIAGSGLYLPASDLRFVHKLYEANPGDRVIAPEWVATDGRWTYFHYGDKAGVADRPVVYRLVDGVESMVNTRTIGAKGETLVAEGVGEFVLRNGQRLICVKLADQR